jgi:hypothetical protein
LTLVEPPRTRAVFHRSLLEQKHSTQLKEQISKSLFLQTNGIAHAQNRYARHVPLEQFAAQGAMTTPTKVSLREMSYYVS